MATMSNVRTLLTPETRQRCRERLRRTREIVAERWEPGKHSIEHPCLTDAISQAGEGLPAEWRLRTYHILVIAIAERLPINWQMGRLDGTWSGATVALTEWNDAPDRTREEVVELLAQSADAFAAPAEAEA